MIRFLLLPILSLFIGCNTPQQTANVIDSEVEGLQYQCAGLFDYTDKNGSLSCNHMPVAFMLGQIKLGLIYKLPQDSLILPQDIVNVSRTNGDDKNLIKVLTLLQSLDEDKNPENGIKIPREIHKKLTTYVDIKNLELAEIQELIETQLGKDIEFKEPAKALLHLQSSMKRYKLPKLKSKILEEFIESSDNNNTQENNNTQDNNNTNIDNNSSLENNSTNNTPIENNSTIETNTTLENNKTNFENNSTEENNNSTTM